MGIHRLSANLAQKIAAGEVIERPLSVVKELLENSIDAGASAVDVELIQGGKVLISVKDDGAGIAPQELPLAVEKHATSKISDENDLEAICTLGYRGEALASIAAVSQLEIFSRRRDEAEGAVLRYEKDAPKVSRLPLRPGTSVIVKDLFYNLPARRKFMKTAAAEFRRISRLLQDYAFAYPSVAFSLTHDGKRVFKSDGSGSVEKILASVWGAEPKPKKSVCTAAASSIELYWQDCGAQSRFQLISFVNGRRISDAVIRSAIQGFGWASRGNWLAVISLPPQDVDVNVHPAKTEILFRRSGDVYDLVRKAAEQFSRGYSDVPLNFGSIGESAFQRKEIPTPGEGVKHAPRWEAERRQNPFSRLEAPAFRAASPKRDESFFSASAQATPARSFSDPVPQRPAASGGLPELALSDDCPETQFLGQLSSGYLVFSSQDGLLIVDPHAAHERIHYERILKACSEPGGQERLIMPVPLPPSLKEDVLGLKEELEKLGFYVDDDGSLSGIPVHARAVGISPVDLLRSAVSALNDREELPGSLKERWASKACKASVKLTSRLEPSEALQLLNELENCSQQNACPHGRPTLLRLSGSALDKHFGRLGL